MLVSRQLKRAWDTTAQHIDSFRQAPRMPQLQGDLFFKRFPDEFCTCSFQVDRMSEVVQDRLQLVGVGSFQLGNNSLRFIHTKESEIPCAVAPETLRTES